MTRTQKKWVRRICVGIVSGLILTYCHHWVVTYLTGMVSGMVIEGMARICEFLIWLNGGDNE